MIFKKGDYVKAYDYPAVFKGHILNVDSIDNTLLIEDIEKKQHWLYFNQCRKLKNIEIKIGDKVEWKDTDMGFSGTVVYQKYGTLIVDSGERLYQGYTSNWRIINKENENADN